MTEEVWRLTAEHWDALWAAVCIVLFAVGVGTAVRF